MRFYIHTFKDIEERATNLCCLFQEILLCPLWKLISLHETAIQYPNLSDFKHFFCTIGIPDNLCNKYAVGYLSQYVLHQQYSAAQNLMEIPCYSKMNSCYPKWQWIGLCHIFKSFYQWFWGKSANVFIAMCMENKYCNFFTWSMNNCQRLM